MHMECLPNLIQLSCLLPQKEDSLRNRITKVWGLLFEWMHLSGLLQWLKRKNIAFAVFASCLWTVWGLLFDTHHAASFLDISWRQCCPDIFPFYCWIKNSRSLWLICTIFSYYINILTLVIHKKKKINILALIWWNLNCPLNAGLRPKSSVTERLAIMCVMPVLLAGVLGAPSKREQLEEYLKKLLVQDISKETQRWHAEIVDAVRFLWCAVTNKWNLASALLEFLFLSPSDL